MKKTREEVMWLHDDPKASLRLPRRLKNEAISRLERHYEPIPMCGCWLWIKSYNPGGYGQIRFKKRMYRAHRLAYLAYVGPIKRGYEVDHLCRVRACINPKHLEAVPKRENIRRSDFHEFHRKKTYCPRGHPYSGDNLILRRRQDGGPNRLCRECSYSYSAKYREKKRNAKRQQRNQN